MNLPEGVSKEEFLEAITEGVKQGVEDVVPVADIVEAIQDGITAAISSRDICDTIKAALEDRLPWPSEISTAIYQGTKKAMEDK